MTETRTTPAGTPRSGLPRSVAFTLAASTCFGLMCFFLGFQVGRHGMPEPITSAEGGSGGRMAAVAVPGRSGTVLDTLTRPMAHTGQLDPDPLEAFMEVFEQLRAKYYLPIAEADKKKLSYGAVRGMLRELGDPYTRFMEPKDYGDFRQDNEGHFRGIGAMLGIENSTNRIQVIRVFPKNPADTAGLKAGDYVIKIDDQPTDDMSLDVAVSKIRGEAATKVKLTVARVDKPKKPVDPKLLERYGLTPDEPRKDPAPVDASKLIDVVITRGDVHVPIVQSEMLSKDVGYLSLAMFNEESYKQTSQGIDELRSKGAKGLVLDLRDNPGGNLDEVVRIVSYFKKEGPVVWIQERDKAPEALPVQSRFNGNYSLPTVVLVNGFSASASEILSGALQDYDLATIIGEKTFGKGLVQTVLPLSDKSALVVTTAVYLTPKKRNINKKGIEPDIKVPWDRTEMETAFKNAGPDAKRIEWDLQLQKAVAALRDKMDGKVVAQQPPAAAPAKPAGTTHAAVTPSAPKPVRPATH